MQARLAKARMLATLQANSGAGGLDDLDMPDFEEEPPQVTTTISDANLILAEDTKEAAPTI